ncbi:MAG TPA: TonB-dependent receptor [Gemmatimonadaceae bacterium]|nr:TonB-dependent receptor [Gemmatimonadaceae bacterium]
MSMSFRIAAALLVSAASLSAQQVTRIEGVVLDADTKRPIADAGVQVVGTTLGTMTTPDGVYRIGNVPAGTVTIQVRRLGYTPRTLTGLMLAAGSARVDTVLLSTAVARVASVEVRANVDRGSVESTLDEQKAATGIVSSVGSEQIARSPDANAAQAIQRVSGVTVQDGKYVFVRGLGERYTTTSLNGTRMPSPEPERKVVPLDLFPSGLLQSVTTSKSFTPDLSGDFSGAHVDIRTREFPGERQVTYGATLGYLEGAYAGEIPFAPGVGGEVFALAGGSRGIPTVARQAGDLSSVTQRDKNQIIDSFRDVWRAGLRTARPNMSFRASMGGSERMIGKRVGYLVSGTYSYSQDVREDQVRALARPTSATEQTAYNQFTGTMSGESVLWGGLFNLSSLLGPSSRIDFNALYNRTSDNDARVERGHYEDLGLPLEIQRLDYIERSMWSTQLRGEHDRGRHGIDWSVSGSGVSRNQPDRSELVYEVVPGTATTGEQRLWLNTLAEGAVRTFAELDEKAGEAKATYRRDFGPIERAITLKAGGLARGAMRDANTSSYGIFAPSMDETNRALPPEELFGGRFTAPDSAVLNVRSLAQGGSYSAEDGVFAGFAMVDVPLLSAFQLTTGARLEHSDARIRARSTIGDRNFTKRVFTDVLPSAILTFRPTADHAVRASISRTLARPEYRELAAIRTRDVLGGVDVRGNPDLVRTRIDNADLRWEFYPRRGELVSAAVFAKRFHDPIERVFTASNTNSIVTFVNAEGADNYGVELELRKSLDEIAGFLTPFSVNTSVTIMRSEINLGALAAASTNANRAMVGQAPYVVNAGLTYTTNSGHGSATLLFNRVGTRIAEAGEQPLPDVKELARNVLDLSIRLPAGNGLQMRFDARNLLDAPHRLQQGSVLREGYDTGRTFQVGVTMQR